MKTIEERAFDFAMKEVEVEGFDFGSVKDGYLQGATEQKKIDIDKACEWLMKYFVFDNDGMSASGCDVFLRKFRKAMEK